jgi:hypothetical protein
VGRPHLAVAAIVVALLCAPPALASCQTPVIVDSYQTDDGTTVNVYRYVEGPGCEAAARQWAAKNNQGNSAGTPSFEVIPDGAADCNVRIVDGTTMTMRGLPRITGGRFVFTNSLGRLVQLPLREVVSTDSGKHFKCAACRRDATGRILPNPAVRETFLATTPCPASGAVGGLCPGYVIDYATPLACGGDDTAANLQWQTEAEVKRKEAWQAKGCGG